MFLFEGSNRSFAFDIDCRHFYQYSFNTRRHTNTENNYSLGIYQTISENFQIILGPQMHPRDQEELLQHPHQEHAGGWQQTLLLNLKLRFDNGY